MNSFAPFVAKHSSSAKPSPSIKLITAIISTNGPSIQLHGNFYRYLSLTLSVHIKDKN